MPGARYLASRAVLAAAVVLVLCAVGFGVWATLTRNSAAFGRQTGLAGVYSLVLAVVVAAVAMLSWASRRPPPAGAPADADNPGSADPAGPAQVRQAREGAPDTEMSEGTAPTMIEERRILVRTKVVTAAGESREIEIFDRVLASQWVRREFWDQPHVPGAKND